MNDVALPRAPLCKAAFNAIYSGDLDKALLLIADAETAAEPAVMTTTLRGGIHLRRQEWQAALPYFMQARQIDPDDFISCMNAGMCLFELGHYEMAREYYRAGLLRNTHVAKLWMKLGACNVMLQDWMEALACYERGVALDENDGECHRGLATAFSVLGHDAAALHHYRVARDLNGGDDPDSESGEAFTLLRMGHWVEGWPHFEARWRIGARAPEKQDYRGRPRFTGTLNDLRGKRVLLRVEQGYGDTIQFSRYIPMVAEVASEVHFEVAPPLTRLFAGVAGITSLFERDGPAPEFDEQTSLMSLPLLFRTTQEACPAPTDFRMSRVAAGGARIGVCWAGGPRPGDPLASAIDRRRSIPQEQFQPIVDAAKAAGAECFSLQLEHLGAGTDWLDTAIVVAGYDLVIAVDTAVAHLAASLGVPTWMLSRYDACWRWRMTGDTTVWYPTMKLYRQKRLCEWSPVIDRVAADLREWAK